MLGLVTATMVTAFREKKARSAAAAQLAPQPLDDAGLDAELGADDMAADGFGAPAGEGELAELDENAFK